MAPALRVVAQRARDLQSAYQLAGHHARGARRQARRQQGLDRGHQRGDARLRGCPHGLALARQLGGERRNRAAAVGLRERFGIEVQDRHVIGAVPQGIADHVRESGAALLVIGPRADPSIPGLGRVAAKLLRAPAVLVARTAGGQPYRSVLSAVDVTEEQERTAQAAVALFPGARHQLLYALDPGLDPASWTGRLGGAELAQRHGDIHRAAVQRLESIGSALAASAKGAVTTEVRIDKPARAVLVVP